MDRSSLLWKLTAEQFAAFDVHLYLDTHPNDESALHMYNNYQNNYRKLKTEFEAKYGPLTADSASGDAWQWLQNPWPWESEAN